MEKTLVDLTAASKELGDPSTRLQMDAVLKMLEHAINSDAGYRAVLLTHPETMTNAFKAYHDAAAAALAPTPSRSDNGRGSYDGRLDRLTSVDLRRTSNGTSQ